MEDNLDELKIINENTCLFDNYIEDIKPELKVRLLNQWNGAKISFFDIILDTLKHNFSLVETTQNDYDVVIDGPFGNAPIENNKAYKTFFSGEATALKVKNYDLSMAFDYYEADNYIRFPLYYNLFAAKVSVDYTKPTECNPNKEHFACFLVSNSGTGDGAIERTKFFHELSQYKQVASGGWHLNNIGKVIPSNETANFLGKCKFVIAYENNFQFPGYMTEKVFQAYYAGSLPLYSAHPQAQSEINTGAIISRQNFTSNQEMINYIIKVDQDDAEYCKIWNQPIITDPNRNFNVQIEKVRAKIEKDFIIPYFLNKNCKIKKDL